MTSNMTVDAYVVREDYAITTEAGHPHVESQIIRIYGSAKTARKVAHLYALEHVLPRAASEGWEAISELRHHGRDVEWTIGWANNQTRISASKYTITDRFDERRMPAPLGLAASNAEWTSDEDEVDDTESEVYDGDASDGKEKDPDYEERSVSDHTTESEGEGIEENVDDAGDGDYTPGDVHR